MHANPAQPRNRKFFIKLPFGLRFGYEYSPVYLNSGAGYVPGPNAVPFQIRHILYLGALGLRLHCFLRGDDARAPHDHPFWFITLPFTSYLERVPVMIPTNLRVMVTQRVRAWRLHFRKATYVHYVVGRADYKHKPFYTLVLTGGFSRDWGFWPAPFKFIPWWEWE